MPNISQGSIHVFEVCREYFHGKNYKFAAEFKGKDVVSKLWFWSYHSARTKKKWSWSILVLVLTQKFLTTNSHQCWQRLYWHSSCDLMLHAAVSTQSSMLNNVIYHSSTTYAYVAFLVRVCHLCLVTITSLWCKWCSSMFREMHFQSLFENVDYLWQVSYNMPTKSKTPLSSWCLETQCIQLVQTSAAMDDLRHLPLRCRSLVNKLKQCHGCCIPQIQIEHSSLFENASGPTRPSSK